MCHFMKLEYAPNYENSTFKCANEICTGSQGVSMGKPAILR